MGRVLIWQCIRFIPACPVSIPTLFIAAQSAGVKKPPGDEGAVLALALADPPSLVTHSHSQNPLFLLPVLGCRSEIPGKSVNLTQPLFEW